MSPHEYFCHACKRSFSKTFDAGRICRGRHHVSALREQRSRRACASFLSDCIQRECVIWEEVAPFLDLVSPEEVNMQIQDFSFGSICIDGTTHEHDVVIEGGEIRKRKKKPSKKFRGDFGHTPLSAEEDIPWKCRRLVIGTGAYGRLPVTTEVKREAERRKVELLIVPTAAAIQELRRDKKATNALSSTSAVP